MRSLHIVWFQEKAKLWHYKKISSVQEQVIGELNTQDVSRLRGGKINPIPDDWLYHLLFVQTHRMYNTEWDPKVNYDLWDYDISV